MAKISCLIVDDEPTARDIMRFHLEKIKDVEIIACCKNALEAADTLNKNKIDLIFLDINMPDMSGISLAKSLPKSTKIIFTTAYREYAVDGFDLQAVDYLLKPISLDRLLQAINKFRSESTKVEESVDYLVVRSDRKMVKINLADILYIESLSDYLKIYTPTKSIITRETISNIESKLSNKTFIRIHRSFIVSKSYITAFTAEFVEVEDVTLPVSRSYRTDFLGEME